jgi:hypothetical protein
MSRTPLAFCASSLIAISGCGEDAASAGATGSAAPGATGATSTGGGDGGAGASGSSSGATGGGGEGGSAAGLVPVFVAQGHMGRTSVSCDGGITYAIDQSQDDAYRCWSGDGTDCDHNPWAGRGVAYGNGVWVETFGWGAPGTLRQSSDLVTWQDVEVDSPTYADVAFGKGFFIANHSTTRISSDGITWTDGGQVGLDINHRAIEFVPHGEGLFVITGESGGTRDIVVSPDGITWTSATSRPPECGSYVLDIAYGDGTIALFSGHGTVCTSTDGGAGWTLTQVADGFSSHGLWTGSEFMVWQGATRYRSADGLQWTSEAIAPDGVHIGGPVARSIAGRFVAVQQSWDNYYEDQRFLWSDDGLVWTEATEYVGGHPINFLQFGHAEPSESCPLP